MRGASGSLRGALAIHCCTLAGRPRFGFATEQAVLFAALAGRPLSEVAEARGTKTSTVRWHLKNLQAKLGTTDKAGVVAWIARSPVCWLAR